MHSKPTPAPLPKDDGELFRMIYDSVFEAIAVLDPVTTRALSVNRAACELLEYSAEELLRKTIPDVTPNVPPFTLEDARYWISKAIEGEPQLVEWKVRTKSERIFWAEVRVQSVTVRDRNVLIVTMRDIDERKRAEENSRVSSDRYRSLFKNMREGFAYCRGVFKDGTMVDFIYLEVNDSFDTLTGLGNVAGRKASEAIPGIFETNPELLSIYGRVALTGAPERFEMEVFPLNAWLAVSVYSPEKEYFVAVFDNVTVRKENEKILRQLSVATEQSPASIVITDPKGDIEYVNRKFELLTGYSRGEVIGKNPRVLKSGTLPAAIYEDLWKTIVAGKAWRGEFLNKKKNGDLYWELASINPILDETGKISHFLAVKEDITKRKEAEAAIMESEERFRLITNTIEEVFWLATPDLDRMLFVSPAYEQIWGNPVQHLYDTPMSFLDSVHPEDRQKLLSGLDRKNSGLPFFNEYRIIRPDGAIRWILDRGYPVRDAAGVVTRYAGIARDVTEEKQMEEHYLRAQRMESIGTLAGGIAHDLNNILAPILMGCELMDMDLPGQKKKELVASMKSCAERGSDIVKQVLSFARGTEGRRVRVQPANLVNDLAKIIGETFPKNIRFSQQAAPDLMEINCDPTRIHQVLLNLCVNARDAMPTGGNLALQASNIQFDAPAAALHPGGETGVYLVLEVADSGTGIPPELMVKIFDPFFTTKEVGKGTGLGLSTVLGIVKSHGGFVTASSEPGKGTSFKVYLPTVSPAPADQGAPDATRERLLGNGETILIVEDEPFMLTAAQHVLEAHGYRALCARDGAEAIAVFARNREKIAAVLMDMMMPVLGGMSTIHALLRTDPEVKIIATSGLWTNDEISSLNELGIDHILTKPFRTETLLKAIHGVLGENKSAVSPGPTG